MGELSRRMMVTGGNVTGSPTCWKRNSSWSVSPTRRTVARYRVRLTREGRRQFRRMAAEHERWVIELMDGLSRRQRDRSSSCWVVLKTELAHRPRRRTRIERQGREPMTWRISNRGISAGGSRVAWASSRSIARAQESAHLRFVRGAPGPVPRARDAAEVRAVVLTGAGGNFCSGGDVHEIIAPLTHMAMDGLLAFTRMTGDLVKAMRACPQPISRPWTACAPARARSSPWPRISALHPGARGPHSCSRASGSPAATWAPARSCRASSARAAPRSCCTPGAR